MKALLIIMALASTAHAESVDEVLADLGEHTAAGWWFDEKTNGWIPTDPGFTPTPCAVDLAKLRSWGVPASKKFVLFKDSLWLGAGIHSWKSAIKPCQAAVRYRAVWSVIYALEGVMSELPTRKDLEWCVRAWNLSVGLGVRANDSVSLYLPDSWAGGAVGDLVREQCEKRLVTVDIDQIARRLPYTGVLKNDKLELVGHLTPIILGDGNPSTTPAALASANVWFTTRRDRDLCDDGTRPFLVTKREFDAEQRVVKWSQKDYCGRPRFE